MDAEDRKDRTMGRGFLRLYLLATWAAESHITLLYFLTLPFSFPPHATSCIYSQYIRSSHSHRPRALPGAYPQSIGLAPLHYVASSTSTKRNQPPRPGPRSRPRPCPRPHSQVMAQAIPIIPDTRVLLPNEQVNQLLARWQSVQATAGINQNLVTDTRTVLHELTVLPDRSIDITDLRTQITTLQTQVTNEQTQVTTLTTQVADWDQRIQNLEDEQATALTDAETAEAAMTLLRTQTTQLRNLLCLTHNILRRY